MFGFRSFRLKGSCEASPRQPIAGAALGRVVAEQIQSFWALIVLVRYLGENSTMIQRRANEQLSRGVPRTASANLGKAS